VENNKTVIIETIKRSFDEALKNMASKDESEGNIYLVRVELPNEVNVESIILDLISLDYSVWVIEKDGIATLTIYYKHEETVNHETIC